MKNLILVKRATLAFLLVASIFAVLPATAGTKPQMFMVEVLTLKDGATADQAKDYFDTIYPIVKKHDVKPVELYHVKNKKAKETQVIHVWKVNPEKMPEIFKDEEYKKQTSVRDSIFDLKDGRQGWMATTL